MKGVNIIEKNRFSPVFIEGRNAVQKVFFTSDTHFGHKNIINSCHRPFSSVDEMDQELISNWNSVVPKDGLVFHLGDFCWKHKAETWIDLLNSLNGEKILIIGNHDDREVIDKIQDKFLIEPRERLTIDISGTMRFVLDHYPQWEWIGCDSKRITTYHLYGHVHNNPNPITRPTSYNVSVEVNNYCPISLKSICAALNNTLQQQPQ